ncbi:Hypothetical_protein [Hexamita inflata]|uniref:Hypothetical_protein n=1 Tax=Hexamita inflata TaxID=28002 RepID=A0AA86RAA8_9EUKA|nr:Hypothetical protein HINF_LOCUS56544 [Hexamita inflata]
MFILSSIIFRQVQIQKSQNNCSKQLIVGGEQYVYCSNNEVLNSIKLDTILYVSEKSSNIFIGTQNVQQSQITIEMNNINLFSVFGLNQGNEIVTDSIVNVSIQFTIRQGALLCIQCQIQIINSTLVFVATGQYLSAVMISSHNSIDICDTQIQYRFNSNFSSGIVNNMYVQLQLFVLTNTKIVGWNKLNTLNNGYYISNLQVQAIIKQQNVQVCSDDVNFVGSNSSLLILTGTHSLNCINICASNQYYIYGICLESIILGSYITSNQTIYCIDPMQFDGQKCQCKQGYLLNGTTCVDILSRLTQINIQIQADYKYNSDILQQQYDILQIYILSNYSQMDKNLLQNTTKLETEQINIKNQCDQHLVSNITQLEQIFKTNINDMYNKLYDNITQCGMNINSNTTNIIKLLNDNISQINNDINGKISALNQTVYILNNLTNQSLGEINDSLITLKQVLQKEIEIINITVNYQIANTSILNNSIQNDLQAIKTNIDILNLSVNISQTNITSIFSQISNLSQQSNSDIANINKSLADLLIQTTVNKYNAILEFEKINNNMSAINQNLSSLNQNLQIINGTLTTNIESLKTDLNEINSSLINLKNDTQSTVSMLQTDVTYIVNNITSLNFTSAQLRTDLSLLNQTLYLEIVNRQNGDKNLQLQIDSLVSTENSNHAQLQTKTDLTNSKVDQLTSVSQNNYTKLNQDIAYANNNCANKTTECQNNINDLWIALHDIQQNVYTKDQVEGNFTKYNAMLINNLSVKAQKKDYCSEKFAYYYNNSLIFYNYPFYSQMDKKCCASNNGMTVYGLGPNDVIFSYLCSNWQDPDTTRGPGMQTQRYVESICGVYPCSNQIPYDQVCE